MGKKLAIIVGNNPGINQKKDFIGEVHTKYMS